MSPGYRDGSRAIAVVWGENDFRIDGQVSHSGIGSVDLARADGDWKTASWMWAIEKDNCPTLRGKLTNRHGLTIYRQTQLLCLFVNLQLAPTCHACVNA